ncbi:MAG: hypothetical protein ACPGO5_01600 [Patescibacteria group bacterium]
MKLKELNKKQIVHVSFALSGAVILGLLVFIVLTVRDIKVISGDIYSKRVALETRYQSGLSMRESIQQLDEIEPSIENVSTAFVYKEQTLEFVNDLEETASTYRLEQIINIPEIDAEDKAVTESPIGLTLRGEAEDIFAYINALDSKPYYIVVNQIELTNITSGNSTGLTCVISGTIHWR